VGVPVRLNLKSRSLFKRNTLNNDNNNNYRGGVRRHPRFTKTIIATKKTVTLKL
jgi:hypothetical protein